VPISSLTRRPRCYVAISRLIASAEELARVLPEHLRYMAEHEDKIFLAGPFIGSSGEGMSVLLCASEDEAREFMLGDPFVVQKVRHFEIKPWEIRFGTASLQ